MPVAKTNRGIRLKPGAIHESVTNLRSENVFIQLRTNVLRAFVEGNSLVVGQIDPNEIDHDYQSVVASLKPS
jgi:hypothetical protein